MSDNRIEPLNDLTVFMARRTKALTSLPGVIWCHGGAEATGNSLGMLRSVPFFDQDQGYSIDVTQAITDAGYRILAPSFGAPFGTTPSSDILDRAYARLQADGHPNKVHLIGVSGGSNNILNWLWRNPTKVASAFLVVPLVDVEALYDRDNTFRAAIEAAYGHVPTQTDYNNFDPSHNHASILPHASKIKVWYGTNDVTLPAGSVENFIAAIGCAYTETNGTHFNSFIPSLWDDQEPIAWFNAHNA